MAPNNFVTKVFGGWCRGGSSDRSDSGSDSPSWKPRSQKNQGCRWSIASKPGKQVKWHKPSKGWTKINTDGSFQEGKASCGGVLRDFEGSIVKAFGRYIGETDKYSRSFTALEAESIGIMDGIDLASNMGLQKVWLESDSSVAVNKVKDFSMDVAPFLRNGWKNCLMKIHGMSDFKVSHIYREGNTVADSLAAHAFYEKAPGLLTLEAGQIPTHITKKSREDASGKVYYRFK